jgi:hypothetical protein
MNSVSLFLIVTAILLLFLSLVWEYYKVSNNGLANEDIIRAQLVAKGLPTPAFADTKKLQKILEKSKLN